MGINISQVFTNRKKYIDLLLIADEQENMIDKYISHGDMFVLKDTNELKSICIVTQETDDIFEIKNIATVSNSQRQGYGKYLIQYIFNYYKNKCVTMLVGTGETNSTLSFYKNCGFIESHIAKNFFVDNYDHPIIDGDKVLYDMVYLKKDL